MKTRRAICALIVALTAAGCSAPETATRNAPLDTTPAIISVPSYDIQDIRVSVPKSLKVSEANRYYPGGDIVWREDPAGDRHAQVKAIFEDAMRQGVDAMRPGKVPAILDIQVTRFHALTEKARYTVGGVHSLQLHMLLRDPETGLAFGEPQFVKADFKALGGQAAIKAESKGLTQKYRITTHLASVIQRQLGSPNGYQAPSLGLMGALNQLGASHTN
ncbi:DUF6778 family protein [Roseovarius atlanticus]|uniref:DUF6778 family protein n=1 Tax=Roseovarius atlanticus TaxID=1641875 RepID=UPI001C964B30|nr:DUF6778 family protein [Roseovarius atlanticus]MBY5988901.1 hypothetical protein [Roseovarius atlanticus]MBY6124292.1 hypothetical protein [Roseovarius atlanticus]MBY6148787.1 hypothetical protein [Roseovarius atlanticus]